MGSCMSAEDEVAQRQKQMARGQKFAESRRGQRMMNSRKGQRIMEKQKQKLEEGAALRQRQEQDTTKGERVWFSRHVEGGRLLSWAVLTHGVKHDFERADSKQSTGFNYSSRPFSVEQEYVEASSAAWTSPEQDGYYVCLIGWTRRSAQEVEQAVALAQRPFGTSNLRWSSCQNFLQQLGNSHILSLTAADYPWYLDNCDTKYHNDFVLPPPPLELLMRMSQTAEAQAQVEGQLQSQVQSQMQRQAQRQTQRRMHAAMQAQLSSQMAASAAASAAASSGGGGGGA